LEDAWSAAIWCWAPAPATAHSWPLLDPRECGAKVVEHARAAEIALVFGRETPA
jgi:tRNA C32,U32 (ribose-2'-O)-methylase TrmJ